MSWRNAVTLVKIRITRWRLERLRRQIHRQRMKAEPSRACLACNDYRVYPPRKVCVFCQTKMRNSIPRRLFVDGRGEPRQ